MVLRKLHMTITGLGWLFAVYILCLAPSVFADSAPEVVGQFTRSDGMTVTAVRQASHAIFYFTGVRCWFSLPDGTTITVPQVAGETFSLGEWERSCVVRVRKTSAEIYRFKKDAFPVASRALQFDGYQFTDVTTPGKRWLSPPLHTWDHIADYLVPLPEIIEQELVMATMSKSSLS